MVAVGLPDGGVFDFVDRFMEDNPGYVELVIERFVLWHLILVLSPRKWTAEMISNFPLVFLPLTKFYQADVEDTCVLEKLRGYKHQVESATDRVELLKSFPETTKKTAVVLVDETNAPFKDWVLKKISSTHEGPGVLRLVLASSITGSLEGAWVHRHQHFVAFERAASRRLQHGRFGLPRWLMDNGFACREERLVHRVQLQIYHDKKRAGSGKEEFEAT